MRRPVPGQRRTTTQNIGPVVVDVAKSLIYFETLNHTSGVATLWYMPITGGTATQVSMPGGSPTLSYSATPSRAAWCARCAGTAASTSSQNTPRRRLRRERARCSSWQIGQLSADGHSISSIVHQYTYRELLDGSPDGLLGNNPSGGLAYDQLPILNITGTGTHAVEQNASIVLKATEIARPIPTAAITITAPRSSDHRRHVLVQRDERERRPSDDQWLGIGLDPAPASRSPTTAPFRNAGRFRATTRSRNYDAALALVKYNTTGDNPTNYDINTTRTISWDLVSDGALNIPTANQRRTAANAVEC